MVLLVSYDLNNHERPASYQAVHDVIKGNAVSFKHPCTRSGSWKHRLILRRGRYLIGSVADEDDTWFVLRVMRPYQGWLPSDVWEWLKERI